MGHSRLESLLLVELVSLSWQSNANSEICYVALDLAGWSGKRVCDPLSTDAAFANMVCRRLGLAIPDGAIEEMKARVEVTDEDLKIAAAEGSYFLLLYLATPNSYRAPKTPLQASKLTMIPE